MRRFTKTLGRAEYGTNVYGCGKKERDEEEIIKNRGKKGYYI
jgi:hypothetical protein